MIVGINPRIFTLLRRLLKRGHIRYKDVNDIYWARLSYYYVTKKLMRDGIIEVDGYTENGEREFKLTPLGEKLARAFDEVAKALEEKGKA